MIKKSKELIDEAVKQLLKYQKKEKLPIKTRYNHFNENNLGGIFPQSIIVLGGISGSGKSYVLQQIEEDFLNKELNPNADNNILVRCNWEMTPFKLLLRKLKRVTKKAMREILFTRITDPNDIKLFKQATDEERNKNIFYYDEPTTPDILYQELREFILEHKDKDNILITIDHIALVKDNGNKKKSMDELLEYTNSLKKEFQNVSFLILTQLNRDIENRTDLRFLAPKRSDLYNSDAMFHIADAVVVIHNPYKLGHTKYMAVPTKKYEYLREYMITPDNKTTNFITEGVIFWHYLKLRDIDEGMENVKDLFIEKIFISKNDDKQKVNNEGYDPDYEFHRADPYEDDGFPF